MSKLEKELQAGAAEINLDALTELVESQLGNVVGGGYSQWSASHNKDPATTQPTQQ
ncbi:hypothetical protein GCM10009552_04560 [Rothia nasimurium]|uniref:Uncharacterized protein n=1 Tax=Luteibacter anthropi TaxID=564369 RepID=A0A7X5UCZ7_9GAMM|nr:hypothetical protein [Luteibacter anthropi]NII07958.1 hypothetical protein [Luteibacter anthropi]